MVVDAVVAQSPQPKSRADVRGGRERASEGGRGRKGDGHDGRGEQERVRHGTEREIDAREDCERVRGAPDGEKMVTGTEDSSRMIREPPSVEDRKPITTPLVTGIKAVDLLAPIGRGQCMLVSGEPGTGLSELGLTSIVARVGPACLRVRGAGRAAFVSIKSRNV